MKDVEKLNNRTIVNAKYDWGKDTLTFVLDGGEEAIISVGKSPGADGGIYNTLQLDIVETVDTPL